MSHQLRTRFGRGFDRTNVVRMIAFARALPDHDDVAELAQQLSWPHIREVLAQGLGATRDRELPDPRDD